MKPLRGWTNPRITGRIAEIDGLRGMAILMVLLFHYLGAIGAPNHPLWLTITAAIGLFWSGVDLFFVLSGFLIAGILIDSARSPNYFTTFYARRVHRIFPVYFFWLILFYAGVYLQLDGKLGNPVFSSTIPLWLYPLFLQNNAPLWLNRNLPLWMAMSWSLAVEEQFYLILPAIIRVVNRRTLAVLSCGVLLLSPLYRASLVMRNPHLNSGWAFATPARLDGLAAGVCVALLVRNERCWMFLKSSTLALRTVLALLLCGFAAMTYRNPSGLSMGIYGFSSVAAMYACLLLLALCEPGSLVSAFLRIPLFRYLARLSYAIYIFHQGIQGLVYALLPSWFSNNAIRSVAVVIVSLTLTILSAELSWRLVERKMIRRAHARYVY